jgi:hypothetical protein
MMVSRRSRKSRLARPADRNAAVITQQRDSSFDEAGNTQYAQKCLLLVRPQRNGTVPLAFTAADAHETIRCLSQCQPRYPQRQIDSNLAFDRQWLQGNRAMGSANEYVGAQTNTKRRIAACTHISSSQHPISDMRGRCEHSPEQSSPAGDTDIEADPSYRPV